VQNSLLRAGAEKAGQGLATRKMLAEVGKLHPDVRERVSQTPGIVDVARAMAERDAEFAAQHGLTNRYDIQNMRAVMSTPGWRQRLTDMLEAGIPLPALMLAPVGAGAAYRALGGDQR